MKLPLVVDATDLARCLHDSDLLLIDLSARETYLRGHIPGAIHLDTSRLMRGFGPVPNKLPTAEQLSTLFSELGVTPDRHVVVYDDQMGPWAGRMIWTLHLAGHQRCSFLNGHLSGWLAQGFEIEAAANTPTATPVGVAIDNRYIADMDYILTHLHSPEHAIWDARSAEEFSGEKVVNAQKGGHIPDARLFEWTQVLISEDDTHLLPADRLRAALAEAGITGDKEIITHCQTHRRSGLTYLAARYLGFERVRCYDGSWFEWGNQPDTPVER